MATCDPCVGQVRDEELSCSGSFFFASQNIDDYVPIRSYGSEAAQDLFSSLFRFPKVSNMESHSSPH